MNVTSKPRLHQDWINSHAIGIVRALQKNGFTTYLVGGCVRDLLLGIHPKDFDIATTAKPDEVKDIIHRAYVIGKRFRLVLVRRENMQFEVATFRREVKPEEIAEDAPASDNVFGSAEEDARRRDFTINGMFYDPIEDQLIDYADGLPDLEKRLVRMIGEPTKRFLEDPIRILRALRLKHMIGFTFESELRSAMTKTASSLAATVLPRRREEILKLLRLKNPDLAFREAFDLGVLAHLSPTLHKQIENNGEEFFHHFIQNCAKKSVESSPGDLFANLVHSYVRAFIQPNPLAKVSLEQDVFLTWMRDELGMFKVEQTQTLKALKVEPLLTKRKEFQRKGERRQKALVSNEAFATALKFAELDYVLSSEDLLYWKDKAEKFGTESKARGSSGSKPRRRRRKPRPQP